MRLAAVAAALAVASPSLAAHAIPATVEGLARASDAVVRGRVLSARAERSEDGLRIHTAFEVRTERVLRGAAPARPRVVVPGGVSGGIAQRVDAAPSLAPGEEVVLFLKQAGGGSFRVTGLAQGKFSIAGPLARPDLTGWTFVAAAVPPGERRSEEMPLVELERRVRSAR